MVIDISSNVSTVDLQQKTADCVERKEERKTRRRTLEDGYRTAFARTVYCLLSIRRVNERSSGYCRGFNVSMSSYVNEVFVPFHERYLTCPCGLSSKKSVQDLSTKMSLGRAKRGVRLEESKAHARYCNCRGQITRDALDVVRANAILLLSYCSGNVMRR